MSNKETVVYFDDFIGGRSLSATPSGGADWVVTDVSSSGTPTYLCASGNTGDLVLTLAATSEAEIVAVHHGDVLPFNINKIVSARFGVSMAGADSATTACFGLSSAYHATPDSTTINAWFRVEGSASTSAIVVETDDNVTNDDDNATGLSIAATSKEFKIDFSNGLSDVRFYGENSNGQLIRVGSYDMSACSSTQKVQPQFYLAKASGTGTPSMTIDYIEIVYKR